MNEVNPVAADDNAFPPLFRDCCLHAHFFLDYFGVVASPLIRALMDESSDKRSRRSAFNGLVRIAKTVKAIPRSALVDYVGKLTDKAGQTGLVFTYHLPPIPPPVISEGASNAR